MMGLWYLRLTAVLCVVAVCTFLLESADGGRPTCLDKPRTEVPKHKRMAENHTTTVSDKNAAPDKVTKKCYRGDWCCFSCLYDASENVTDFYLKMHGKDGRTIFNCERKSGPPDSSTFTFDEKQQELCLKGLVNESGRYECKMEYEALRTDQPDVMTVTEVTMADKLGTPTVTVVKKVVTEGGSVTVNCSLDTKDPDSINATFYNGTNLFNPDEKVQKFKSKNHITFRMEYTVTRFDNRREISCNVTDGDQNKTSANVPLNVQYSPRVECNITGELVVGHPAKIICAINANPDVPLNSKVFPEELFHTGWEQKGRNLSTSELQPPCNQTLTITANNNVGKGEAHLLMDCLFEASISAKFNRSGNIFSCNAKGNPVPEISWLLLYENNTIKSYNSTASTLELSKREVEGVNAVICKADQRQPLYFLPNHYTFNLTEQNNSSSCQCVCVGTGIGAAILVILFVVGLGLGYCIGNHKANASKNADNGLPRRDAVQYKKVNADEPNSEDQLKIMIDGGSRRRIRRSTSSSV